MGGKMSKRLGGIIFIIIVTIALGVGWGDVWGGRSSGIFYWGRLQLANLCMYVYR